MQSGTDLKQMASQMRLILKLQASVQKWKKKAEKSRDRYFRLRELISTEQQYLSDLQLIKDCIMEPLKDCGAISDYEANQMFPNLQGMITLSHQLLTDLPKIFDKWDRRTTLLGPAMIPFSHAMLLYSDFFKNYSNTLRKLKLLVDNNQKVKALQTSLSQKIKFLTFHSLMTKPFQRPLKYHLILKEYEKQTPEGHPDKMHLKEAVEFYQQVNNRNNDAMEHKQKSQVLMKLDSIFRDTISSEARYFITKSKANIFNVTVNCYILSDMVLVSRQEGEKQTEYARVHVNHYSFVLQVPDGIYMKNRLLLCGSTKCIWLEFTESDERDRFCTYLNGVIQQIINNQYFKEKVRSTRRNTVSSMMNIQLSTEWPRQSIDTRDTMSYVLDRTSISPISENLWSSDVGLVKTQRTSIRLPLNLLAKPPRIFVIGPVRRSYSSNVSKLYYLTKFQVPSPNDYHQILYISQDDMALMERLTRVLYFKERDLFEGPGMSELEALIKSDDSKGLEYRTLYYTLLLNRIFRHPETSKRLDIYAHKMGVSESLWLYLKYSGQSCRCQNCKEGPMLNSFQKYNMQMENRQMERRKSERAFYCPYRTFNAQDNLLTMPSSEIVLGIDRLIWMRTERGNIQYRLLDNPLSSSPFREVIFQISCGLLPMHHEKKIGRLDRVGQIKHWLSRDFNVNLSEYQMCMEVNNCSYILGDDEILWNLLENQQESDNSLIGFFKNTFGGKEDTKIRIVLKRVWWLVQNSTDLDYLQRFQLRMDLIMESLAARSKEQEIQFSVKDLIYFYAGYLLFKEEKDITLDHLQALQPPKKWKLLNSSVKKEKLKTVSEKMQRIAEEVKRSRQGLTRQGVFRYMLKIFRDRAIWGVYCFVGRCSINGNDTDVRVGFDLSSFVMRETGKVTNIYECRLSEAKNRLIASSSQLRIVEGKEVLWAVRGSQFVQMVVLLQEYVHFASLYSGKDV